MSVRHFGTSADMSGQFGTGAGAEVSGTSAEMSWVRSILGPKCLDTFLVSDAGAAGVEISQWHFHREKIGYDKLPHRTASDHIGSNRTTSDCIELHWTMSDHVCKREIVIS